MRKYKYSSVLSIIAVSIIAFFLLLSCGDLDLNVKGDEEEETTSSPGITISCTFCLDGDATGTCNDVGVCSNSRFGDKGYCEANGDIWNAGADTAVRNAKIYLKNGSTVVKMGKTVQDGTYAIPYVQPGTTYTVEPSKEDYFFIPALHDTDKVNAADPTADFTAIYLW